MASLLLAYMSLLHLCASQTGHPAALSVGCTIRRIIVASVRPAIY